MARDDVALCSWAGQIFERTDSSRSAGRVVV
jgi:hypothetical protein